MITRETILTWLEDLKDPEVPVLSIVDLGIINKIDVLEEGVSVTITPTFVGCPAIDFIRNEIIDTLHAKGLKSVHVAVSFEKPWTSDNISEKGRKALKEYGFAPPPANSAQLISDIDLLEHATCPRCGRDQTEMKSLFGPTLCRSIFYCHHCREAFEQFKPI